jgi:hypothetical protein
MRGPYPSRRRRAADGEEGRGPGGVGKEDGERRGGGFERKELACILIVSRQNTRLVFFFLMRRSMPAACGLAPSLGISTISSQHSRSKQDSGALHVSYLFLSQLTMLLCHLIINILIIFILRST